MCLWVLCALLAAAIITQSAARADIGPPPARYDHAFRGHLNVVYLDQNALFALCGQRGQRPEWLLGCTEGASNGACTIHMRNDMNRAWRARILRHEVGHCNGWPGDHRRP